MCSSGKNKHNMQDVVKKIEDLSKKPSLETFITDLLHEFHKHIRSHVPNFSESAIFVQGTSHILEKQIDLLYKELLKIATRLSEAFNSHEQQVEEKNESRTSTETPLVVPKAKRTRQKKDEPVVSLETSNLYPEQTTNSVVNLEASNNNNNIVSEPDNHKLSIPGIPDEIMQKLNLSDCMLGGPVDEFIDKLDPNDPRYTLFTKLGQEMCKNKDVFTYNNLSLSGISWNALYQIEKVLNNKKENDLIDNHYGRCFDSGIESNLLSQNSESSHCIDGTIEIVNDGGISSAESCYGSMIGSVPPETTIVEGSQNSENDEAVDTSQVDLSENPENATQSSSCTVLQDAENEEATVTSQVDYCVRPENGTESNFSNLIQNSENEETIQVDSSENGNCEQRAETGESATLQNTENGNITTDIISSSVDESVSTKSVHNNLYAGSVVEDTIAENSSCEISGVMQSHEIDKKNNSPPDLPINMFKFSTKLFTKSTLFQLPGEYNCNKKPTNVKDKDTKTTLKRKSTELTSCEKRCKIFSLENFENFWNSAEAQKELPEGEKLIPTNEQQKVTDSQEGEHESDMVEITIEIGNVEDDGTEMEIPDTFIDIKKESLDNPSEWNCGRPITPESGRSSFFSEFEHLDEDEDGPRRDPTLSRADSGIELSAPLTPASIHPDELASRTSENPTLKALKALFPTTFSDPERAQVLKDLYRQPEDSEDYNEWKKFINEKTANETEFDIHKSGTEILNSFPTKVEGETISFHSVVQDKSVGGIAKLFVSALQLANTYNVEIQDDFPNQIRPDAMKLKFLSNDRPHEDLDMFGPSTSSMNNLMNDFFNDSPRNNLFHSTPYTHADPAPIFNKKLTKRRRLDYSQ